MAKLETMDRRAELTATIWEGVGRPWLLGIAGGLVLLLYLVALFVQQMPGQLQGDPAGAARWVLATSEAYGAWGSPLRTLGLFNILHNPLLQLLLILIVFVLLIQLGSTIATVWRLYQFDKQLVNHRESAPDPLMRMAGEPVVLPPTQSIFRLRHASVEASGAIANRVTQQMSLRFDQVRQSKTIVMATPAIESSGADAQSTSNDHPDLDAEAPVTEEQILALRHVRPALLRPLLYLGLFTTLLTIWFSLIWGWALILPPLAPGAEYRSGSEGLFLQYRLAELPSGAATGDTATGDTATGGETDSNVQQPTAPKNTEPQLVARIGDQEAMLALGSGIRMAFGQTYVRSQPGAPALFMRTLSEAAMISRLGQTQMVPSIGLVFPGPGSEESVVINQALGLRIVRVAGNEPVQVEQFLIDIYDVNANELINRISVQQKTTIDLSVAGMPVTVEFIPLPSLRVTVEHQPGIWLLWPALLLILSGLVGYAYRPAFVLVQLAPWPVKRTVVVIQSDVEAELNQVAQWLVDDGRSEPVTSKSVNQ